MVDNTRSNVYAIYGIWLRTPNAKSEVSNNTIHKINPIQVGAAVQVDNSFDALEEKIINNNIKMVRGFGI